MERNNQQVQEIIAWRESLTLMNDNHFFELIRMYLGEIKTPYNKQKLLEELSAFLRKGENVQNILKLLSPNDILILSAVKYLAKPTQEKLSHFFMADFTFADLYERLLNLEERLLIYRKIENRKSFFAITPQLKAHLEPFLSFSALLPNFAEENAKKSAASENTSPNSPEPFRQAKNILPQPTSMLLASIFSFFFHEDDLCKADGTFKKRCTTLLNSTFSFTATKEGFAFFMLLFEGLKNLQLIRQNLTEISCRLLRWENFCRLDDFSQICYVVAASCGACSPAVLQRNAQLIMTILMQIPDEGFSRRVLNRSVVLNRENAQEDGDVVLKKSRLAELLQEPAKNTGGITSSTESEISAARIVEQLTKSGLLIEENGAWICSPLVENYKKSFCNSATAGFGGAGNFIQGASLQSAKPALTIDADFSACILNTPSLAQLLPLMRFLKIENYDAVPHFEISKKSCSRAFDSGFNAATIKTQIEDCASHKISQSLDFSLNQWFENYSSAFLYRGYVLKAASEKKVFIENNEKLKPYINAVLGDGIYLLDFFDDEEAKKIIGESGLDFVGAIKTVNSDTPGKSFARLSPKAQNQPAENARPMRNSLSSNRAHETNSIYAPYAPSPIEKKAEPGGSGTNQVQAVCTKEERDEVLQGFLEAIENSDFSAEQKDGLVLRVKRKIVVNPSQLRAESVRFERVEASGMDYSGKVHVIEHAISSGSLIELLYDGMVQPIVGEPLNIEKANGDAIIHLRIAPTNEEKTYSVSKANLVKRIRGSIFKIPEY